MKSIINNLAELKIWAYLNPLFWPCLIVILLTTWLIALLYTCRNLVIEVYQYNSVKWASRERVEKYVQSYHICAPADRKNLLNKNTKSGRKLRRYTVKNINRLKELNKIKHHE